MPRITQLSLPEVNRALGHIDELKKQIGSLQSQLEATKHQVSLLDLQHAPATTNNLVFTWTGSTHTLSWAAGSIADKNAGGIGMNDISKLGGAHNVPVSAGSLPGLLASTYYWLAWNKVHQQMIANQSADVLFQNKNNLVICKLYTGTAGQTGIAGGGGSASSKSDLSGFQYKLF